MKLNHVDLQVSDVTRTREFFERFFDLRCGYQREEQIALLEDGTGFSLGLSNLFGSAAPAYPRDFHIGFILARESEVRAHYERLKEAGVPMQRELGRGGPNLYFMCIGPDSIPIEVRAPLDEE